MLQSVLSEHSLLEWSMAFLATFVIGLSKAGLRGIDIMNVTIMALVFGSKTSTGIVLPLLCIADIMAVVYYNRHADWKHFKKLMPWMIVGVLLGWYIGKEINEAVFKRIMAVIIVTATGLMIWWERRKSDNLPSGNWFSGIMGISSGFTTMLGNLAGAFSNIYFLVLRFPKNEFIGTVSWLFLFINLFKVPFHVFSWNTITAHSLLTDVALIPAIFLGFWAGAWIVKKIKSDNYRKIILALTVLGAVIIFFR
ncbi:sulfite exporter TauE/SafE family protein [Jiulongibacter sp. NS-SX5]|uniref:sulfite exporter TauE/SafE family protein n=1 Tax=Jiulongibacter sp. NS-SX5 TaxID=3463854 RepID=UPI0040584982